MSKIGNIEIVPKRLRADTFSVDGKEMNFFAETEDVALLLALERKYLGLNSQFAKFACRMLGIKSAWSE